MAQSNQDDLIEFLKDPETIKRAAEGSMEKRLKVMAQSNDDNIRMSLNICYDPKLPKYVCLYQYTYNLLGGETIEEKVLGYIELRAEEDTHGTK